MRPVRHLMLCGEAPAAIQILDRGHGDGGLVRKGD